VPLQQFDRDSVTLIIFIHSFIHSCKHDQIHKTKIKTKTEFLAWYRSCPKTEVSDHISDTEHINMLSKGRLIRRCRQMQADRRWLCAITECHGTDLFIAGRC